MSATPDYDTGPLNWVRGDIDAALQAALGRIQAFSLDAELTNALRLAHDDAHQVTGALRMVGLEGAATVAAAMESCLADINENRLPANDEMLRALRNGFEGLQRWIKDLADGRGSGELALFPLYKRLRELQGAERVFEGELFFPDLRTRVQGKAASEGLSQEALAAKVKAARGQFQLGLLAFLRNVDAQQGLTRMRDALAAIEQVAPSQASHTFWWACVGFVDSLIAHGVEADFHVKQLLARVDLQMRRLMEGSPQVAERLLRDALFFVAKSQSIDGCAADVRSTFGLDRYLPGRGLLDPETMARMRPVLEALGSGLKAAHDSWHAYVEGNAGQMAQFQSLLDRMQPQSRILRDSGLSPLLQDLSDAAGASAERDGEAREQMNLEVASTLLFLQNAVEHEDVLHADFAGRAVSQQARLRAMIEGREVPSLEVESSAQREAERDMLVHMAQEVGQNLRQMEAALDAFFRDAGEREALAGLPALAQQAQGALTMLELTDAASLLAAATAVVQPFASEGHPDDATQRRLADAFSSLGLFIESYCAGRADAARILRPVLAEFGVAAADSDEEDAFSETVESGMPARKAGVKDAYLDWRDEPDDGSKKKYLDALTELNRDAELIDDAVLKQQTRAALDASREVAAPPVSLDAAVAELTGLEMPGRLETVSAAAGETEQPPIESSEISLDFADTPAPVEPAVEMESLEWTAPAESLVEIPQSAAVADVDAAAVTEAAAPQSSDHAPAAADTLMATVPEGVEPELLEIFLEEVNEVLATMGEAVEACQGNPDDQSSMTVIRRGFHTLKGSGRMVGLNELGETAWRHEQLLNGWLAENKPASSDLLRLVTMSRSLFQDWVNALHTNEPVALPVPALLAAVDRVAQGQPFEMAPVAEAAPIVEAAAPALESVAEMVAESVAESEAAQAETIEFTPVAEAGTGTEEAAGFEIEFQPVAGIEGESEAALAETFEFTPVAEAGTGTEEAAGFEIEFQPVAGIEGESEAVLAETFEFTPVAEAGMGTEEAAGFEIEFQPVAETVDESEAALAETIEFTPVVEAGTGTEEAAGFEIEFQPVAETVDESEAALAAEFEFAPAAENEPAAQASTGFEAELPPVLAESGSCQASVVIEYAQPTEAPSETVEMQPAAASLDEGVVAAAIEPEEEIVFSEAAVSEGVHIGPVCLSTGLYEIFMTEVHQRLAVLLEEVDRQAGIASCVISEQARRAVHTLAGIAGTAGISALAELSHALEQYWNRFVHRPFPEAHLPLVQDTVERLQIMVATIEAEYLPEPATDLIAALGELEDEQILESASWLQDEVPAEIVPPVAEAQEQAVEDVARGVDVLDETEAIAPDLPAAEETGEVVEASPAAASAGPLDIGALVPEFKISAPVPVFERREVTDEIDEQLLPIFLEEAETLVPDTSAQLRAWKEAPGASAARDALSRNLHTIKGSARMVGAMRLGELTHVMESRVVAVAEGHLAASGEVFHTLEAQLDRLADAVERLRRGDLSPVADEAEAPLAEPIEPVLSTVVSGSAEGIPLTAESPAVAQPASREVNSLTLRVRADWVDRMVNQAGEVAIARSRIESEVFAFKRHVNELTEALVRLRSHIREVEIQAESQMQANFQTQGGAEQFDPLEFDRFTRFQEVTRFLAESVNDISTVQHILLARLGEADAALIQQTRLNRELQQNLLRVRMVPLHSVAERLYRTVRQTARDVDKRAQLDIRGGDLEIDRSVLEKVTAPLEHLLRNALAHGIETPAERSAAGKSEFGEIVLSARQTGNEMLLTVKDDGAGLNYARIREKAVANGLLQPGAEPADSLLAQMIFAAGFSTADTVSQVAGRGVGMDVVKSEISALGGRIEIESTRGAGTCFNIYLPLTLAMTQAVMVHAAKHDYALPTPLVQQVLELKPEELAQAMAAAEVTWRGTHYPLSYLPHLLGDTGAVHEVQRYNQVIVLQSGSSLAAVLVDSIEGTREVVVKNIGPQMARITGVAGATVRGDGRVILILNPVPLAMRWASQPRSVAEQAAPAETVEVSAALQPPMVLVVDDSLTVRKITTRLLTREGYRVDSAKDGVDALEKMHDLLPDVVLLDVEMPRMDGFELARVMHDDVRLKPVPIIMITSRTADKHRQHAMELGVKVYMGKPYQEEQLLETIAEQLGQAVSPAL